MNLKQELQNFWNDEEGLTTVEYAVGGSLIAAAVIAAFDNLGGAVDGVISDIESTLDPTGAYGGGSTSTTTVQ